MTADEDVDSRLRVREAKVSDHEASLKVGAATFADLRQNILSRFGEVKEEIGQLRPKPRNEREVVFFLVSLAITVGAGIWGFGSEFNKRPTNEEVAKLLATHESSIHPATHGELRTQQQELSALRLLVDRLSTQEQILKSELDETKAELRAERQQARK
jgi:hypothetical protein